MPITSHPEPNPTSNEADDLQQEIVVLRQRANTFPQGNVPDALLSELNSKLESWMALTIKQPPQIISKEHPHMIQPESSLQYT